MTGRQAPALDLVSRRLGPLPLVNHFLSRLDLESLLGRFVPPETPRAALPPARGLLVLLRSILLEREPIYRQQEVARAYTPEAFELSEAEVSLLSDDRLGRALDRLFDANRAALLTEVALALHRRFDVAFDCFHNDSTTVKFTGQYEHAKGRSIRGKKAPWITYGYSKDHRSDLKQLLYVLTTTGDGHVPVHVRCLAGNTNDSTTHVDTWNALVCLAGQPGFLYVADSKLCGHETMDHINRHEGRFLTVLPRSRGEDGHFRRWIQTHVPQWETVRDRPSPRGRRKPRDVWKVWRSDLPSAEGWPITWVSSSLLALRHARTRRDRIERAGQELDALNATLARPRCRVKRRREVHERLKAILVPLEVTRYLRLKVETREVHQFRQLRAGRPSPKTAYRRITKKHFAVVWRIHEPAVTRDQKHDGMYPLVTNDASLSPADVLRHHKGQPRLEHRFRQMKDAFVIAPVFLKNEGRIEALFFLYALALLVQALIEREIRRAMEKEQIPSLPIYPEERPSRFPTAPQVFRLFAHLEHHVVRVDGLDAQEFPPALSDLQKQVLRLLGVPLSAYARSG